MVLLFEGTRDQGTHLAMRADGRDTSWAILEEKCRNTIHSLLPDITKGLI